MTDWQQRPITHRWTLVSPAWDNRWVLNFEEREGTGNMSVWIKSEDGSPTDPYAPVRIPLPAGVGEDWGFEGVHGSYWFTISIGSPTWLARGFCRALWTLLVQEQGWTPRPVENPVEKVQA
jgi:hypothetical protein